MLLPGPECVMGPRTGLLMLLPRPVICHGPLYRLPMLLPGPECVIGPCTASHCCCQARNLPWAPVPTPHAAARPVICHGPCTASSCCCQVQSVSWVPVRPPLLLSPSPHSAMCHFQVSSTLLVVSIFCHRVLYGLPLLLPPPPHCGSTLWFWPR
ncbi:unnamed protein product [Staurois parvus]|uniref:Uncharacterized protein n=1 Tax=Staurois parvus TaxID=386267 RepID=A0ABN9HBW4_9NEOB|nr:unnamed protein product [Staurois parvus]